VIDCRTISEPGTPATRSPTPVPVFNGLYLSSYNDGAASTIGDQSGSNPNSPGNRSPTPTPALYEDPTRASISVIPPTTDYHNNDEMAIPKSLDRMQTPALITDSEPISSDVSRIVLFRDVENAWYTLRLHFGFLNPQCLENLSQFKHIAGQYIQESAHIYSARRAVLDLVVDGENFIPVGIHEITRMRGLLEYKLSLGYDINERDSSGNTVLLRVCQYLAGSLAWVHGCAKYLSLLIEHGANVHSTNPHNGRGALHCCIYRMVNHEFHLWETTEGEETLAILLEAGCNPEAQSFPHSTPMSYANPVIYDGSRPWRVTARTELMWQRALARTSDARLLLAERWANS
jgi:hypothetical protein